MSYHLTPGRVRSRIRRRSWHPGPKRRVEYRQLSAFRQMLQARGVGGMNTRSKIPVNEQTALQLAAVFCAVRIRSGVRSILPLQIFERTGTGVSDAQVNQHPVSDLLRLEPNPWQVPAVWKEQQEAHLCLYGNSYTEMTFDRRTAEACCLTNYHPNDVNPFLDSTDRDRRGRPKLKYEIHQADGGLRVIDRSQMIHTPALGMNGLVGSSVIRLGAESMGVGIAQDRLAATFYGNSNRPFLIVSTPGELSDAAFERLSREINEEYMGDDAFSSMLLEGGAQADAFTMSFADAQFVDSKKLNGEEIAARWFGLPPHLAGFLDNAHFDNVEEQDRAFVMFTLAPLLVRHEQEMDRKLFTGGDRGRFYTKYNVDALLRGALKERYEAHASALRSGWKTINEVRADEDMAPMPGGNELPKPAAIWGKQPLTSPPPGPAANDPPGGDTEPPDTRSQLRALTAENVRSLQASERIQAEKYSGRDDFVGRMTGFYENLIPKALGKLSAIRCEERALRSHFEQHLADLTRAASDADPEAAVKACLSGWDSDPDTLAETLIP